MKTTANEPPRLCDTCANETYGMCNVHVGDYGGCAYADDRESCDDYQPKRPYFEKGDKVIVPTEDNPDGAVGKIIDITGSDVDDTRLITVALCEGEHVIVCNENKVRHYIPTDGEFVCDDKNLLIRLLTRLTEVTKEKNMGWREEDGLFYPTHFKGRRNQVTEKFAFSVETRRVYNMDGVIVRFTLWIDGKHKTYEYPYSGVPLYGAVVELHHTVLEYIKSTETLIQSMIDDLERI